MDFRLVPYMQRNAMKVQTRKKIERKWRKREEKSIETKKRIVRDKKNEEKERMKGITSTSRFG